jgi:hypothetical protein
MPRLGVRGDPLLFLCGAFNLLVDGSLSLVEVDFFVAGVVSVVLSLLVNRGGSGRDDRPRCGSLGEACASGGELLTCFHGDSLFSVELWLLWVKLLDELLLQLQCGESSVGSLSVIEEQVTLIFFFRISLGDVSVGLDTARFNNLWWIFFGDDGCDEMTSWETRLGEFGFGAGLVIGFLRRRDDFMSFLDVMHLLSALAHPLPSPAEVSLLPTEVNFLFFFVFLILLTLPLLEVLLVSSEETVSADRSNSLLLFWSFFRLILFPALECLVITSWDVTSPIAISKAVLLLSSFEPDCLVFIVSIGKSFLDVRGDLLAKDQNASLFSLNDLVGLFFVLLLTLASLST